MMKKILKAVCLLLSVVICAGVFASCGKGRNIVAIYDGDKFVYQSDVKDITNYQIAKYWNQEMTDSEKTRIKATAVDAFVQYLLIEEDLKEKGFEIDKETLNERFEAEKAKIEGNYEGGYKAWRKFHGVSRRFLKEEARRMILQEKCFEDIKASLEITDEVLRDYMNANGSDYYDPAGYNWTMIFREVKNLSDADECAAAKAEAQAYIEKIRAGELTIKQAEQELLSKYTKENGYTQAVIFNGADFTDKQAMPTLNTKEDLDYWLTKYDTDYKNRDPQANPSSKEYESYLIYITKCMQIETYYALQNLEINQVYENPIFSLIGYGILVLDAVDAESGFPDFEDIKETLREDYTKKTVESKFESYVNELYKENSVLNAYKAAPVK